MYEINKLRLATTLARPWASLTLTTFQKGEKRFHPL